MKRRRREGDRRVSVRISHSVAAAFLLPAFFLVSLPASAAPVALPSFPLTVDGAVRTPPTLADLDGNGRQSLIVVHGAATLSVFDSEGQVRTGFPVDLAALAGLKGGAVVGALAAGDVTGDGRAEIAVAVGLKDGNGKLLVLRSDGTPLPSFPVTVPRGPGAGPTLADVDEDGTAEVAVGARDGRLHVFRSSGESVRGFPSRTGGEALTSPVAFGRLGDHGPSLVVGAADGRVHAIRTDGKSAPGFPVQTRYAVTGAPALADLDGDGAFDVVVTSLDYKVHAFRADGSTLPGFPVSTAYRIYGGPAVGDLDRDGSLDVVAACSDGRLHAWSARGKPLKGFPVNAGARIATSPLIADGDRDGWEEIYLASGDGRLYGFRHDGRALPGFPMTLGEELTATPVLGSLVPDGSIELVAGTLTGSVVGLRLPRSGALPPDALTWPAHAHDSSRSGRFSPNPPRYRDVRIVPATPRAGQPLHVEYDFHDLDGDAEPHTRIRWSVNGQPVAEFDERRVIPGERVRKGARWRVSVQGPEDHARHGDGPFAHVVTSPETRVANTPPGAARIAIEPAEPTTIDALAVRIVEAASDVDGDVVRYRQRWFRDGDLAGEGASVAANGTRKGERWRVEVTPHDGEDDGPVARAEVEIRNTAPSAPVLRLSPERPTIETPISVLIQRPASDADGDVLAYRQQVKVNGRVVPVSMERLGVPAGIALRGERVEVEAWAFDGEVDGPRSRAEVVLVNAAPEPPRPSIFPANPLTSDTLVAGLAGGARDADGDPVTHRIRWYRDGFFVPPENRLSVPPAETRKGERWEAEFTSTDGVTETSPVRAAVHIGNSPPTAPVIAVDEPRPTVDREVTVRIASPSTDPDGDEIVYEYSWTVNGKPLNPGRTTHRVAPFALRKNTTVRVAVTAVDSEGARSEVVEAEIRPRNTPPGPVTVRLRPAEPTVETGLEVVVESHATDRDGDRLEYRHRWSRNGLLVPELDGSRLAPGTIRRDDTWTVEVAAFDGEEEGPASVATARIHNVAPSAPVVVVRPERPTVATGLECAVQTPARDADGDPLTLIHRWSRNGESFPAPADASRIPPELLSAGERWTCEVSARDHAAPSPVAVATALVENAAPLPPAPSIEPEHPVNGSALSCVLATAAVDPDGERPSYAFRWIPPAGVSLPALDDPARIPGAFVRKGQRWACEVSATDGRLHSSVVSAERLVGNSPPGKAIVRVLPKQPAPGDELRCDIVEQAVDPDGDRVVYTYEWLRNDERQAFAEPSRTVPGRLVRRGDRWRCVLEAGDGDLRGPAVRSPEVTVNGPASGAVENGRGHGLSATPE